MTVVKIIIGVLLYLGFILFVAQMLGMNLRHYKRIPDEPSRRRSQNSGGAS